MTEEKTKQLRREVLLLLTQMSDEQLKLVDALLRRASLKAIGGAFDGVAAVLRMILTTFLTSCRPEPLDEVERIGRMFDRAASAGRKVLLAAVRHVRG
jgi:hypothetical protein